MVWVCKLIYFKDKLTFQLFFNPKLRFDLDLKGKDGKKLLSDETKCVNSAENSLKSFRRDSGKETVAI